MIDKQNIQVKPPWERWLCIHKFSGGARVTYDSKGRKRYARICSKCGQRKYVDGR